MAREWRSGFLQVCLLAPFGGTALCASWNLPHFDDGEGQHALPCYAPSEEGATIVRFFFLRKVLDSCDVTLSHLAHIKCLPRQNCSFDLFFLKAASLEGRHRKAQLGLKHAEDAARHICTARNFLWWTSACSHLLGEKLTTNYSYHATTAWQATNMSFACRQHMGLAWTDAESCSTILVASLALETSNPPGLVDFSGSVLPVQA